MKLKKLKPFVFIGMGVLLVSLWVWDYKHPVHYDLIKLSLAEDIRAQVLKAISVPGCGVGQFVEKAHRTVTVSKAPELVSLRILTTDGTGELLPGMRNLDRVEVEVRVVWDGWFHNGGETLVAYTLVRDKDGVLRNTRYRVIKTSALYTRSDCK